MSRVGKAPIKIPAGVQVKISESLVEVSGAKGTLRHQIPFGVQARLEGDQLVVAQATETDQMVPEGPALHGLTRSLLANMVHGTSVGFTRELDIVGVGYRAAVKGAQLTLTVGYSHPIHYDLPSGVSAQVTGNTHLILQGADKMLVGLVAAKVRSFRKPEPYKGKGIKYTEETIVRKQGKTAAGK